MPASVTLNITKGENAGESYLYTEKASLILGRDEDCGIVLKDETVSRYHCMVEILPPAANFRDFGSGNGIRLNGKTVAEGRFRTGQSIDEAREGGVMELALKDGDIIALSSKCELSVRVFTPEYCAECMSELDDGSESLYQNEYGENICGSCHVLLEEEIAAEKKAEEEAENIRKLEAIKAEIIRKEAEKKRIEAEEAEKRAADEAARLAAEKARIAEEERLEELRRKEKERVAKEEEHIAAEKAEKQRLADIRRAAFLEAREEKNKCMICGNALAAGRAADAARICLKCQMDPLAQLDFMLRLAIAGAEEVADIKGYRTISELGRGGMGAVFKVEEEASGEIFALKVMLSSKNATADMRAKFLREASLATQLKHPNILIHYSYGGSGDAFYMLQEICEGGSVDKLIDERGGKLPFELATDITLQILDALVYAHAKPVETDLANGTIETFNGIVHRDIKPGNFFLMDRSAHPTAKLADFGMAKAFESAGMTDFTRTGDFGGTPVFMPRQQITEYKYAEPDVDVWAVAASYYFMLTGCFPKDFGEKKDVWSQALKNPAVQIRKRDRSIDKRIAEVIDHALIERPAIGFSTALELKKAIEGAI